MKLGLVGATNVGKSTLFNRLIGQFRAIVTDIAGTTIDIIEHNGQIEGIGVVSVYDSPGLSDFQEERKFISKIIESSDIILFLIDDSVGLTAKEQQIFGYIIDKNKKDNTILIINKLDKNWKTYEYETATLSYYELGISNIIGISAKNELNIDNLIKSINILQKDLKNNGKIDKASKTDTTKETTNIIPIAIVGKPNSGKSTLLNQIIGQELSKVEDKAGTTRDYVSGNFKHGNQDYTLYDTAGIRKKGKIVGIERIAYQKTLKMLEYIKPLTIFMIDANEGISHRDMTLIEEINMLNLPMVVCLNKMDLLDKTQKKAILKKMQSHLDFAVHIPIIPIIAKTGEGQKNIIKMIDNIRQESKKRIDTNSINKAIAEENLRRPPRFPKNKICKIYYATQIESNPPTFMFFINHKDRANFAFKKRIENSIRKHFGFIGCPIVIRLREKKE